MLTQLLLADTGVVIYSHHQERIRRRKSRYFELLFRHSSDYPGEGVGSKIQAVVE